MADRKKKKNRGNPDSGSTGVSVPDMRNRTDILNGNQIDENPKNPPRVGDPEYMPPIRL